MAFTDFAAYLAALRAPREVRYNVKDGPSAGTASAVWLSQWTETPFPGTAPGAAAVPTRATVGSVGQQNATTGSRYLGKVTSAHGSTNSRRATWMLCDRLSHQSGLSGTAGGAQTTNLPTAALTRYTTGVGVMAALEIYTAVGATPQTVTCSYTNQAGTAGRTSQPIVFGAAPNSAAERFAFIALQLGDYGVRSVESVTLSGSTGTAGNFGVTLFKPIIMMPEQPAEWGNNDAIVELGGQLPEIVSDACLWWIAQSESTTIGGSGIQMFFVDV